MIIAEVLPKINKTLESKGLPMIGPPEKKTGKTKASLRSADINEAFASFLDHF